MKLYHQCIMSLLVCALPGCSDSTSSVGSGGPSALAPTLPIGVTGTNASKVATVLVTLGSVEGLLPDSKGIVLARGESTGSLPSVVAGSPNSTALALALSLVDHGPGTLTGPLGGDAEIAWKGDLLFGRFHGLRTLQGTIDGEIAASLSNSSPESGNYVAAVTFNGLSVQTPRGTWLLNGPANLDVARSGSNFDVSWESNMTLSNGGSSVAYQHFLTTNRMAIAGAAGSCSSSLAGSMTLNNVNGLSGVLTVTTPTPLAFSGNFSNHAAPLTLTAGVLSINGGQLTLSVTRPDVITIAAGGTVIKQVAWAYLGGPLRLLLALRPTVADQIFTGGNFLTVSATNAAAQALAVQDGRILAVGTLAEATAFQGPGSSLVPLHGKTCLPGFVEPHMHISLTALNRLSTVNSLVVSCGTEALGNTIQTVLTALDQAVAANPTGPAIYGYSFDPSRLIAAELMQNLTLTQLDQRSATIPIVVQNASQHISYVNSAAFRASGIWPTAPMGPFNPPADLAQFIPTVGGLPTGQVNERAQDPFISLAIGGITGTPAGQAQYLAQWRLVMNDLAARGITTTSDLLTGAALGLNTEAEVFGALELDPTNPCRLRCYIDTGSSDVNLVNIFAGEGYDRLRFIGAKIITDGSTQGLTAGLNFNYIFPGPFPVAANGLMDFASLMDLLAVAKPWYDAGFQLSFHANGDRAQDQVFAAVHMMQAANPRDARTRIEHFTVHQTSELASHVATARDLKLEISHTIGHVFFWGQVFNNTLLGADVSRHIDPIRSLMAAGVWVSTHSDSPVSSPNPLHNIQTVATRLWQGLPQQVLGADETVSVPQAIRTVTFNAAHALFCETEVGSLEFGKLADLVILGDDPTTVASDQIANIPVIATYLEGKRVSGVAP